jgi:hypothetical protein
VRVARRARQRTASSGANGAWHRPPTHTGAAVPAKGRTPQRPPAARVHPKNCSRASRSQQLKETPAKQRESTRTGRKNYGKSDPCFTVVRQAAPRDDTVHAAEVPSVEPQVCNTSVTPSRAPRCFDRRRCQERFCGDVKCYKCIDPTALLKAQHAMSATGAAAREDHGKYPPQQIGGARQQPTLSRAGLTHLGQCRLRQELCGDLIGATSPQQQDMATQRALRHCSMSRPT